ncbi:Cupredoxin [Daldinia decipiens]|uniref:Cupredoxin n=1 Tax=Daldinia decipiens TaxID=326647 RepID=UPI0020C3FCAE|nr:Cupredoxin [Daldinia decipiens]KAI1659224.1 Cupredoxin [Daldinia decipiens]
MKYATALSLAVAPLAIAKAVNNVYPQKRTSHSGQLQQLPGLESVGETINLVQGVSLGQTTQVIVIWANPGNNAQTTTLHEQVTVTKTVTETAAGASATAVAGAMATHTVQVGGSAGLVFVPDQVQANVGDMVIFEFMSMNHTATQSTFAEPCKAMEGGMDSGFQANPNNTVSPPPKVAMQVMTTEPLWFYCKQKGHCGKGMTFSINPSAEKTQALFQAAAIQQNGAGAGSAITGNATEPAVVAPAASSAAPVAVPSDVTQGTGTIQNGACVCAVQCSTGSFPVNAAQGIGAFGGFAGGIPSSMMETV